MGYRLEIWKDAFRDTRFRVQLLVTITPILMLIVAALCYSK